MLDQKLKVSPNGSFNVSQLCKSVAICEAVKGDRYNWGNATGTEPAFLVYLGCNEDGLSGYLKTINTFYSCEWCEVRKPKYLKDFTAEIKIRGMQRYADTHAFGLDSLVNTESLKPNVTAVAKQPKNKYIITLDDCLEDIASNFIYEESEYSQVPPFIFIPLMFEAVNELIDQFSSSPEKYLSHALRQKIDEAVSEYLAAA
ncbi:MAG: hypothetical protein AAFQ23_05540 [Cyanobacteria bacterium J06623_1]